jgi:hypothetical protein
MSSYLNIYVQPRDSDKKLLISDYSSCSEIFTIFRENLNIPWTSSDEYKQLTSQDVSLIIDELKAQITKLNKRITEYEKFAGENPEYVEEILENKESVEELMYQLHYFMYLKYVVRGIEERDYLDFNGIFINIT